MSPFTPVLGLNNARDPDLGHHASVTSTLAGMELPMQTIPGWLGYYSNTPAFASPALGLKANDTMPGSNPIFKWSDQDSRDCRWTYYQGYKVGYNQPLEFSTMCKKMNTSPFFLVLFFKNQKSQKCSSVIRCFPGLCERRPWVHSSAWQTKTKETSTTANCIPKHSWDQAGRITWTQEFKGRLSQHGKFPSKEK